MSSAFADETDSFWLKLDSKWAHHGASDPLPATADVVVVGGGYAGCALAYWLTQLGRTSMVVLEARGVSSGATGRNGGHLAPRILSRSLIAEIGLENARRLVAFERRCAEDVQQFVEKHGV